MFDFLLTTVTSSDISKTFILCNYCKHIRCVYTGTFIPTSGQSVVSTNSNVPVFGLGRNRSRWGGGHAGELHTEMSEPESGSRLLTFCSPNVFVPTCVKREYSDLTHSYLICNLLFSDHKCCVCTIDTLLRNPRALAEAQIASTDEEWPPKLE